MIQNIRELENTREKLRILEEGYEEARQEPSDDEEVRETELQSLKQLINEFKEEIARCECHVTGIGPPRKGD
jgi:hypothetical protein